MSDEKIDHAAEARASLDFMFMGGATSGERAVQVAKAQVHATLALMEQQRIANLIAYASHRLDHRSAIGDDLPSALIHLLASADFQAREGLGLGL